MYFTETYHRLSEEAALRDNDAPSSSLRKVLIRAEHFEEDWAALGAAVAAAEAAAAAAAAEQPGVEIAQMTFRGYPYLDNWFEIERRHHRISFGHFVDQLAQLPGHVAIRAFQIVDHHRFPSDCYREQDMERLFGDLLPTHPSIERILIGGCELPSRFSCLLASSLPSVRAPPLLELTLQWPYSDTDECVEAICNMLRRNVPLRALLLSSFNARLAPANCRMIFQSLALNTHLEGLYIEPTEVTGDEFCLAAPVLRALHVRGHFKPGGIESVVRRLRTNTTLVELRFVGVTYVFEELVRAVEPVLRTYNFTIRSLRIEPAPLGHGRTILYSSSSIPAYLRRNERIHRALQQFPAFSAYHEAPLPQVRDQSPNSRAAPAGLLPRMMEMVRDLPTLLYRFLRETDINDLVEHLLQADANKKGGGKNKRIRMA
jgi:hypothetical protein